MSEDEFKTLLTQRNFAWEEFYYGGAANLNMNHPGFGLNAAPPAEMRPRIVHVATIMQAIRLAWGSPLEVLSTYRSPEYNAAVGSTSRNHTWIGACDVRPKGGLADSLWEQARALRSEGLWEGGLGRYTWGIHVDIRGYNADW